MRTDDPSTPGPRTWELNLTFNGQQFGRQRAFETPLYDLNYGVGNLIQLKFEIPLETTRVDRKTISGWGSYKSGIKYNFYNNEKRGLSVAVYPQLEFRGPGSNRQITEDNKVLTIPILVSKRVSTIRLTTNLGYNKVVAGVGNSEVFSSFAAGIPITPKFAAMGEFWSSWTQNTNQHLYIVNVGVMRSFGERFIIYSSAGRSIGITPDGRSHLYAVIGIKIVKKGR